MIATPMPIIFHGAALFAGGGGVAKVADDSATDGDAAEICALDEPVATGADAETRDADDGSSAAGTGPDLAGADAGSAGIARLLDSVSRFKRRSSERMSAAVWERRLRSFSRARRITSSSFAGISGFKRNGGTGARVRIEFVISAELSPRKGNVPVAISYRTMPNENKSVRPSKSFAPNCSGDM